MDKPGLSKILYPIFEDKIMTTSSSNALYPNPPIVNQGNPYINGMRLTWLTTTTFQVEVGQCRDSTNTMDILMGNTLFPGSGDGNTNSLSNSVAVTVNQAVQGINGIDVGTVAASTLYSVFAVGDSRGFNNGGAVISLATPTVGPHLPLGYDSWRYIGSVSTNATPHIRPFTQTGAQASRTIWYDPGTGPATTGVVIPNSPTTKSTTYINVGVLTSLVPQSQVEFYLI